MRVLVNEPRRRAHDRGLQHFLVGLIAGIVIGLLIPIAAGWWAPL